jgi:hypothetical protein
MSKRAYSEFNDDEKLVPRTTSTTSNEKEKKVDDIVNTPKKNKSVSNEINHGSSLISMMIDATKKIVTGLRIPNIIQNKNLANVSTSTSNNDIHDKDLTDRQSNHLDWSNKQRRILTCNGMADTFYTKDRGFPFTDDELPHFLLGKQMNGTYPLCTHTVFAQWKEKEEEERQKQKKLIPSIQQQTKPSSWSSSSIIGVWKRPLFSGGFEHSTDLDETVYNVQSSTLFIDLRIPVASRNFLFNINGDDKSKCTKIQSIYDLTPEQLRYYSRQHIFAGYSRVERKKAGDLSVADMYCCTRHHCIDWNYIGVGRTRPNKWYIEFPYTQASPTAQINHFSNDDAWKEYSFGKDFLNQHYYCERWERNIVNNKDDDDTKQQIDQSPSCSVKTACARNDKGNSVVLVLRMNPEHYAHRQTIDDSKAATVANNSNEQDSDRDGVIILIGNQFNYCISRSIQVVLSEKDRNNKYRNIASKGDYIDELVKNNEIDTARKILSSITGGHGVVSCPLSPINATTSGSKWKLDTCIEFWKEGSYLFSHESGIPEIVAQINIDDSSNDVDNTPVIDENGKSQCNILWNDEQWDICECQNIDTIRQLKKIFGYQLNSS